MDRYFAFFPTFALWLFYDFPFGKLDFQRICVYNEARKPDVSP